MKTKWFIIPAIIIVIGCAQEIDTNVTYIDGEFTLHASGEKGTKTVLQQDGCVFWSPEDYINVFYGDRSGKFSSTNSEEAATAEFIGNLGGFELDGETEFVAAYPYSAATTSTGNTISITLPSEQAAEEGGTFADDLFICVAKSKDFNLHFYNVCGGVKFSLTRKGIKKIVFRGNNGEVLAGRLTVGFSSNGIPQISSISEGKTAISLVAPYEGTFTTGEWFYIVLPPQVLQNGYTIELHKDVLVETISSYSPVSVRRSVWGVLKNLTSADMVDLGLSVMWGTKNIGASKPEERGDYYAWGETEPKDDYSLETYKWYDSTTGEYTKYSSLDNRKILDPEDDVAHVRLGDKWRMPTKEEVEDLIAYCDWTYVWDYDYDGILAIITSKINGNCIILPAVGGRNGTGGSFNPYRPEYFTSSLWWENSFSPAYYAFVIDDGSLDRYYRDLGHTIRPVYGDYAHPVEHITLDKSNLELSVNETSILVANILPSNATNQNLSWCSSNESVATVSSLGVVTGISVGSSVITVTTSDGGKTATCTVSVTETPQSTDLIVDLGLSVKWASCNLGANNPEEFGDYYAWGETEPYYSSLNPLTWKAGKESGYDWPSYSLCMGEDDTYIKYCTNASNGYNGFTDDKIVLDIEDDAAFVTLGGKWRLPTVDECSDLLDLCTWERKTLNGVDGYEVTGKTGKSIFLPMAGWWDRLEFNSSYNDASFWASSIKASRPYNALGFAISEWGKGTYEGVRSIGCSIRPVYDDN